jgi:hypothetical protein
MRISFPEIFEKKPPTTIQDFQDLTITLYCANLPSQIFTIEILKEKKIIPQDWKVKPPQKVINKNSMIQLSFENSFQILAQPGKIIFITRINRNKIPINRIISNFIYAFPQINYYQIQIIPRRLISLPGDLDMAENFIRETLLHKETGQIFGKVKPKVQMNFVYKIANTNLLLKINSVYLKLSNSNIKSALLFRGIFTEKLINQRKFDQFKNLDTIINNYPKNLDIFKKVVNLFLQ